MKFLIDLISEQLAGAFEKAGFDAAYGKATLSNRPDLCEYQCNGALAAAKQYHKAPIQIANAVLDALGENKLYSHWSYKKDGASLISQLLFEQATDINFYVGRAINPAHQNPDLPVNFNIKMNIVEELSASLKQMGKRIKVSYF